MRALVFTLMCIAVSTTAISATVYKWVDQEGVTHYSDQPHPGAQKIEVQAAQTYNSSAGRSSNAAAVAAARNGAPSGPAYSACAVIRPLPDEMFTNTTVAPASVHVDPGLRPTDRIAVLLDGTPVQASITPDSEFTLTGLLRGTHSIAVRVEDKTGAVVCQSAGVTFNVHQASALAPNLPAVRPQR
jgi:Domain of unknown function (DUF4124)